MPWLETVPVEQRARFIDDHRSGLYEMTELCARYAISRKTGYKWLARYDAGGRPALQDRSRAPHSFKPVAVKVDGKPRHVLVITLPAALTKGGKTTGEIEHVYAGSERLKKELARRRFQLKRNPDAYVFGTEDGRRVRGFRRMWRELFRLAGLDFGRDKGLTWHMPTVPTSAA